MILKLPHRKDQRMCVCVWGGGGIFNFDQDLATFFDLSDHACCYPFKFKRGKCTEVKLNFKG